MIGEYVRLAAAELARVLADPARGEEHVEGLLDTEDGQHLDVDKAWDAIGFLLRRADVPVDIVHGGRECLRSFNASNRPCTPVDVSEARISFDFPASSPGAPGRAPRAARPSCGSGRRPA